MRLLPLILLLALPGCVGGFAPPRQAPQPVFDPIAFFAGRSEGHGTVRVLFGRPSRLEVRSQGRLASDGSLVLEQSIERAGHRPQQRSWRIRRVGANRYAATLSSAEGPVAVAVEGNILRLDFREHGLHVRQDIALAPDGRSALNHMTLSRLGFRVAAIEERIVRGD